MEGERDGREGESKIRGAFPGLTMAADHELRFTISSALEVQNKQTKNNWPGTVQGRCSVRTTGWGWITEGFNRPL